MTKELKCSHTVTPTTVKNVSKPLLCPPPLGGGIKRRCASEVWRLTSAAYIGPKSRTERPRKTKIDTEVAHVTRDSGHHFRGQKVKGQGYQAALVGCWSHHTTWRQQFMCHRPESPFARGGGILWRPHYRPHSVFLITSSSCISKVSVGQISHP